MLIFFWGVKFSLLHAEKPAAELHGQLRMPLFTLNACLHVGMCLYVCGCVHAIAHVCRSEDSFWELVLSFLHVYPQDMEAVSFCCQHLLT